MVAGADRDAHHLAAGATDHIGHDRLRTVAAGHSHDVRTRGHSILRELSQVDTWAELVALDAPGAGGLDQPDTFGLAVPDRGLISSTGFEAAGTATPGGGVRPVTAGPGRARSDPGAATQRR